VRVSTNFVTIVVCCNSSC